jgi:hypothetical protein
MTDKERFQRIKNDWKYDKSIWKNDIPWLINRVEELEKALDLTEWQYAGEKNLAEKLKIENKRYREALKNIYELAEYDEYDNTLEQIVSEIEKTLEGEG